MFRLWSFVLLFCSIVYFPVFVFLLLMFLVEVGIFVCLFVLFGFLTILAQLPMNRQ